MEKPIEIRQFVPDYKRMPVYCSACSSFATVEVRKHIEGIDMIAIERFCAAHSPLVQSVAA